MADIVKRESADNGIGSQLARPSRATGYQTAIPDDWDELLNIRRLADRLFKRKLWVLVAFLAAVVPTTIATVLAPRTYRSTALVQVNPDPVQVLPYRDIADTGGAGVTFEDYMGTQEQVLRGAGLRTRVAKRLRAEYKDGPAALEVPRLADRFSLRKIEKSQLFELSYEAGTPDAAAVIVNVFSEEFAKHNFELRQATRLKAEQDLKKELASLEARLQLSEKELMAYAKANDIMSLEQGQVDPLQERLSILGREAVSAEAQVVSARSSFDGLKSASIHAFPQRLVTQEIGTLQTRLLQLDQELTSLRSTFGENWRAVREKREEAALVRQQLETEKAAVLDRNLEQARLDLRTAETRLAESSKALAEQKTLVNRFHDASIEYNILKREVDTNRNLYDGMLERLKQTGVLAGFQFGNIQVVEPGRPNRRVNSPQVLWNLGLASLLGLALGVSGVMLLEFWDNSITTIEEAEQLSPLPILGSVPLLKGPGATQALLSGAAREPEALPLMAEDIRDAAASGATHAASASFDDSVRSICASILLSRSDERPRVIAITSAMHAEGKTTFVMHLGKAFADTGVRTLLIEADLRRPDLSRAFGIGNESGLSLYLAGHVSPWPKVHPTHIPNLFVAAGGPVPPNPAALLHSERLSLFLQAAAEDYDVVIVDSPPLLSMADARILGLKADGVVLVVRAGRTGKNHVKRAWMQLESSGANVLGMVLNGWEPGPVDYSQYHYQRSRYYRSA